MHPNSGLKLSLPIISRHSRVPMEGHMHTVVHWQTKDTNQQQAAKNLETCLTRTDNLQYRQ